MFLASGIYYSIVFITFYIIFFILLILVFKNLYNAIMFSKKNSFIKNMLKKSIHIHNGSSEALSHLLVICDKVSAQELVIENKNKVIEKQESIIEKQESIIMSQTNIIETQNRELQKMREKVLHPKEKEKQTDNSTIGVKKHVNQDNAKRNTGLLNQANEIINNSKNNS